jgi:hypothetical protein
MKYRDIEPRAVVDWDRNRNAFIAEVLTVDGQFIIKSDFMSHNEAQKYADRYIAKLKESMLEVCRQATKTLTKAKVL